MEMTLQKVSWLREWWHSGRVLFRQEHLVPIRRAQCGQKQLWPGRHARLVALAGGVFGSGDMSDCEHAQNIVPAAALLGTPHQQDLVRY